MLKALTSEKSNGRASWQALFNLTILSAYLYVLTEWLFFMSRPSSLSILALADSVRVLFVTAGVVALISAALLAVFSVSALVSSNLRWRSRMLALASPVPAFVLAISALMVLDNLTEARSEFGIIATEGFLRGLYALGFLLFFCLMLLSARRAIWASRKFLSFFGLSLLLLSMAAILMTQLTRHPAIIILGSDGLSARYLTAYDPQLKTTPFLAELARTSLVAENAFPNAGSTTGSTTSVLTGKQTLKTKVYRYSDVLSGRDSLEHLPGILRQHGYQTVEIGAPNYVDARKLNLLEGFDIVNGQVLNGSASGACGAFLAKSLSTIFIQTICERASERLLHIFFVREMRVPFAEVAIPDLPISDEQRVDEIIGLLDRSDRPLFLFVHLMDTHGPRFAFQSTVFSGESSTAEDWDESRYQDALLSFDGHVKRIYEYLAATGKLDDTVLAIYTDHGFRYAIHERIPLMIHFPGNANAGRRKNNVQNIDIPATLLDSIGIPVPAWMSGTSLLQGEAAADRPIISTTTGSPKEIAAPFYQINIVQLIVCHRWYALNVRRNTFDSSAVAGHTSGCAEDTLPSDAEARQKILEYLQQHGYSTSSLEK